MEILIEYKVNGDIDNIEEIMNSFKDYRNYSEENMFNDLLILFKAIVNLLHGSALLKGFFQF